MRYEDPYGPDSDFGDNTYEEDEGRQQAWMDREDVLEEVDKIIQRGLNQGWSYAKLSQKIYDYISKGVSPTGADLTWFMGIDLNWDSWRGRLDLPSTEEYYEGRGFVKYVTKGGRELWTSHKHLERLGGVRRAMHGPGIRADLKKIVSSIGKSRTTRALGLSTKTKNKTVERYISGARLPSLSMTQKISQLARRV